MRLLLNYLSLGFLNPTQLLKARQMSRKQVLAYFALLAFVVTLSLTSIFTTIMSGLREDGQEIASRIPPFEIANGEIVTEESQESYIHQTNSFLFFFDPNGEIAPEEIDSNLERLNVPIGVALLEESIYMAIPASGMGGRQLPFTYDQLSGFNSEGLSDLFLQIGAISPLVLLLVFLIGYLASLFTLAYDWLILSLFANVIALLLRLNSPFKKNARMALLSLSIPTLVISAIEAFGFYIPFGFEIKLVFGLYFLYQSFKPLAPKIERKDK